MQRKTKFYKAGAGRAACAALLAGTLAMPATAFAAAGFPDSDVEPGKWYVGHVQEAVDAGIVRGYPDGTFRPEEGVTRAQVAEMLCRAEGAALPEGEVDAENETPWTDVEGGMWYTHAMNWAYENGVFTGDSAGTSTVRPDDGILREEMAKAVASYMEKFRGAGLDASGMAWPEGTTGLDELSPWAEPFFLWLANQGVMGGHVQGDGTSYLEAKGATTRAQFAKLAVKASTWTEGSVPGGPGAGEEQAAIAKAEACDVVQNGATIRVFDAKGADITSLCEFAIGSKWQSSPKIDGLAANTEYTVHIRLARVGDKPAGPVFDLKFRTAAEEEKPEAQIEIARLEAYDVTSDSASFRAFDAAGKDITSLCEFAFKTQWQSSPVFSGLSADTEYTMQARAKAVGGKPAGTVKSVNFRTLAAEGGGEQQKAEAPAGIRFFGVGQTSFGVRPVNAEGDLLDGSKYEYRLDGGEWVRGTRDGYQFPNLKPDTEYSVSVRTAAGGGLAASDAVTRTVRTQAEQGEKPSPQAVWVTEYKPIMTNIKEVIGTGRIKGVCDKWQQDGVTGVKTSLQTEEMKEIEAADYELGVSMEDNNAPFNEDWDSVQGWRHTTSYVFVKTGGHWETPKDEAERQKLYSYNTTEAKDYPVTVVDKPITYIFTCADGKTYASKKEAFNSGSKIVGWTYGDDRDDVKKTHDFEKLIREAGGTPGEAWCYTGETLATMDGNSMNQ